MGKTIQEIYDTYEILDNLQLHMLRVAGVCSLICDSYLEQIDKQQVITAALLHDMGNLVKFDFTVFDDAYFAPQGKSYWIEKQQDRRSKYGTHSMQANLAIVEELGVDPDVANLFEYSNDNDSYESLIVHYGDRRVDPHGIVSLAERITDLQARYQHRTKDRGDPEIVGLTQKRWNSEEVFIFEKCEITPTQIDNHTVTALIDELRLFTIE